MNFEIVIGFAAALTSCATAVWAFLRWGQSFVSLTFITGMLLIALRAVFSGMGELSGSTEGLLHWSRMGALPAALLPGTWILFSLSFARVRFDLTLQRWKWAIVGVFAFPLVLVSVLGQWFFGEVVAGSSGWLIFLGWSGQTFHLLTLLGAVLILANLERTFRASAGAVRWEIKFLILGASTLWAAEIYAASQTLLFASVSSDIVTVFLIAVVFACALMGVALWRGKLLHSDLYVSRSLVHNSIVSLAIGGYLVLVGLFSKLMVRLGEGSSIPVDSLILFVSLIGLVVVLLSDGVRQRARRFLSRHLNRPQFDYRRVWTEFMRETSSLLDKRQLAASVANMMARTFGVSSVGIWLWEPEARTLQLLHGTLSVPSPDWVIAVNHDIGGLAADHPLPCDLAVAGSPGWAGVLRESCPEALLPSFVREVTPLLVNRHFLGFVSMNTKLTGDGFSAEDLELFRTLSEQTAASLLNIRLSETLTAAREEETFRRMSAFFVHDLKNVAANLSLTVKNLPRHFGDPEFRADALRSITRSVEKMNNMCGRLSSLRNVPSLSSREHDLAGLVETTLAELNGIRPQLSVVLRPAARVRVDADEFRKVIHNLVLNAVEASKKRGRIDVRTGERDGAAILSVQDEGCGMSRQFIDHKLFRPFTSTKEKGLGIGLFQCRQIVEAHGGRIEVESREGEGSTFTVYLPAARSGE